MGIFLEPLFDDSALRNLRLYRYSAVDKSPIVKYILRHWWDFATSFFPLWVAPNLITLSGLGFIICNLLTAVLYLPDLRGPAPPWVYYSFALGLFLYQTFDNVDGRQARRTGSSSALGHIFDHTVDSLNVPLAGLIQAASLGLGQSRRGIFIVFAGLWGMWLSTWEEYHTETLYLGFINGPCEGILIACAVYIISGLLGPAVWMTPSHLLFPWVPSNLLLIDIFQSFVLFAFVVFHAPECLKNVYLSCKARSTSFWTALAHNVPFIVYNILAISWALSPYSCILADGAIENERSQHGGCFIEFVLLATFTFAKLGPRVILARLTKSPFPWFNFAAFVPMALGTMMVNFPYLSNRTQWRISPTTELWYLRLAVAYTLLDFVVWFVTLCRRFMVTLDIGCLSIKHRKTQ